MASPLVYKKQIPLVVPYKGKIFAPPRSYLDVMVPLGENDGSKSAARYLKLFTGYFEHNLKKLYTDPMLKRIAKEMSKAEELVTNEKKQKGGDPKKIQAEIEKLLNAKLAAELKKLQSTEMAAFIAKVRAKCQKDILSEAKGFVFEEKANAVLKVALGSLIALSSAGAGIVVGVATMGAGAPAAVIFGFSTIASLAGTGKVLFGLVNKQIKEYNKHQAKVVKQINEIEKLKKTLRDQRQKLHRGGKLNKKDKLELAYKLTKNDVKKLRKDLDAMEKHHLVLQDSIAKQMVHLTKMQESLDDTAKKVADIKDPKAKEKAKKGILQVQIKIDKMESNLEECQGALGSFNDLYNKALKGIATLEKDGDIDFAAAGAAASTAATAAQKAEKGLALGFEHAMNVGKIAAECAS